MITHGETKALPPLSTEKQNNEKSPVQASEDSKPCYAKVFDEFWGKRFFLYFLVISIAVAAAYPEAGRRRGPLKPRITVSWVAVILIFYITGLKLKTHELKNAAAYWKLNVYVICFTYILIPSTVYVLSLILRETSFNSSIIDGMIVMSCLPTTISMCVILTKTGGGNEAAAVFNATVSNFLGIFLTPALLLLLLGQSGSVSMVDIIVKLVVRVVVPVVGGQVTRFVLPGLKPWISRHGKGLKRFSEILLLFIVYATFCQTFYVGVDAKPEEFAILLCILIPLHLAYLALCFTTARFKCLGYARPDIVTVLFCSTQKTVALGIPLITAIYEESEQAGILSVPLLIYHPMQLVVGSLLINRLYEFATQDSIESSDDVEAPQDKPHTNNKENKELGPEESRNTNRGSTVSVGHITV
uniref:Sodium/bile acid cotransporter n=1 Tax=Amorphochlora amoebiformis TaxID=1561963 RepID=A0A7S0D1Q8_9EUKA|mmetsp:Transcript_16526/g.26178  ORF Transcript_16526/g.26178 Transcript_16526/m.26178 type:complete len:414 (+) Transcript_16526:83-1324(+)